MVGLRKELGLIGLKDGRIKKGARIKVNGT
jgi:hypothetical protein